MAGAMRKMAVYLGLMEDDVDRYDGEYGEYDEFVDDRRDEYRGERPAGNVAAMPDRRSMVQAVPTQLGGSSYRITTVHPRTYNEARTIGEHFREGIPVIMNLSEMDDNDAKRLVDFSAGLVFATRGTIERVTSKVFLLSPPNVTVAAEDKQRIAEGGFFNQS
jgi:cell division inhibitor SepF